VQAVSIVMLIISSIKYVYSNMSLNHYKGEVKGMQEVLASRIKSIAVKHCACYPSINEKDALEQLYAIESTLEGVMLANTDCRDVIETLCERYGISWEQAWGMGIESK
jgi:hypothetical protein